MPDTTALGLSDDFEFDDTFLHARKEALIILGIWFVCLLWTIPYCYLNGFTDPTSDAAAIPTVWGIPSWVFWGVGLPWLMADIATTWFCFVTMKDDNLGEAHEGADLEEQHERAEHAEGQA